MEKYLFIESRDPYDSADSPHFLDLVKGVRERNNDATLFLIQNSVFATQNGTQHSERYRELAKAGVSVLANAFLLRERAIDRVVGDVKSAEIEGLVGLLPEPSAKAIWRRKWRQIMAKTPILTSRPSTSMSA